MKKRLAIITTHPIQYNAPLFALLTERGIIDLKVFYTWGETVLENKYDPGFGKIINWDIDLLKGYQYEFIENVAADKGSHHFKGIDNPGLIRKIQVYKPDAILVYGWPLKSHYKVMRYFKGKIPVLFRGDSHLLDQKNGLKSFIRSIVLKWVYRYVDIAFYVGKSNYDYYRAAGLKEDQLVFSPHAIDNNRFSSGIFETKIKARNFRDMLGIQENDLVFLFAGKFEDKKNPLILLNAFLSAAFNNDIHLVFVGNGVLEFELKKQAKQSRLIHFMDFCNQSDMPAIYEMSNVFVLPSKGPGESWGLTVNEAMANGKPIIVSNKCGCAATLVENGKNGFVFEASDEEALKGYLKKMVTHRLSIPTMGDASKFKIEQHNFKKVAETFEAI